MDAEAAPRLIDQLDEEDIPMPEFSDSDLSVGEELDFSTSESEESHDDTDVMDGGEAGRTLGDRSDDEDDDDGGAVADDLRERERSRSPVGD